MQSRWDEAEAARCESPLALRVYSSRLLGSDPSLVLFGGGNTSVKIREANLFGEIEEVLYIKGSGRDLATIDPAGFAPVRLAALRRLTELPDLPDRDMVRAQRAAMLNPAAPSPSVEALLHALIPLTFVDHTHADAVVAVSNTPDGERRLRELYGDRVLVVPYVMPGFLLAKTVRDLTRAADWTRLDGMVLLHHGVFTFAEAARTSYERMIELVSMAEGVFPRADPGPGRPPAPPAPLGRAGLVELARLRRAAGRIVGHPVVARLDQSVPAAAFASRPDVEALAGRGPLTPDHVIRTKRVPLVTAGDWEPALADYADRYQAYFRRNERPGLQCLDPAPRWIIWQDRGFVTIGGDAREAAITGEIARHTARAIEQAERLGGWQPLSEPELFEVEYWELEQAKLRTTDPPPFLRGKLALVTGAASGIGRAVAKALRGAGASVTGLDLNPEIGTSMAEDGWTGLVADVTDGAASERAIEECITRYGGIDILVSNAGVFPGSRRIGEIEPGLWESSLAANLTSHLSLIQSAVPYLRFGFDPSIVIIGSKNVPAPGPGAAAYSVAKAGLAQLARVAALELAQDGIRVNTLHPHLVLDTGAWSEKVLAERAGQYGMTVEQYKRNNLLGVEIESQDIANAVLALVGPWFAKTTGAQIPVDGGSDRVV